MTNLATAVLQNDAIDPDREAITFLDQHISYQTLQQRIRKLANALAARGIGKGDRVSVLLTNCPQFLESYYAITSTGAIYVPLNTRLSAHEHIVLLNDCAPKAIISSPDFAETLAMAAEKVPSITSFILVEGASGDQIDFDRLVAAGADRNCMIDAADDDAAAIVYTSGTTSLPKGVVLTHGNYLNDWVNLASVLKPTTDSVNLQFAPLYHAAIVHSLLHLRAGARTIMAPKFDPGTVLSTIGRERVTHIFCVPTVIYDLIDHPDFTHTDFSSLRTLEYGAAPMTRTRLEEAMRTIGRPVFVHAYGMTETTSHCCTLSGTEHNEVLGSIGRPMPLCRMRIVDDADQDLPPSQIGEIVVQGPNIMDRYWNREPETAAALKNGWLHTGDLGKTDENGCFFIVDRKKDMIISGGVNIYPKDIEEVIALHPSIAEVAVYGIPHERWGESVAAAVRLRPGTELDEAGLAKLMEVRLGRYQIPKAIKVVDEFPRNGTGKIMKHVLRKLAAEVAEA